MQHVHSGRAIALAALLIAPGLTWTVAARADTSRPVWKCRASAAYAILNAGDRAEAIVANGNVNTARGKDPDRALCGSGEAGAGNLPAPLGIPSDLLAARTTSAITSIDPELGVASEQKVNALGRVESLTLQLPRGGAVILGVTVAESAATGQCAGASPELAGSSRILGLTLAGVPISADRLVQALTNALSSLTPLVTVRVNETIRTASSLTVRALHIVVRLGNRAAVEAVIAESKVGFDGAVCTPPQNPQICPNGSKYDAGRNRCIIPSVANSGQGDIIVGRPFQGPSGGTVVPLDIARRRYGDSPCLSGSGRKFAIVGTNEQDRITGTNQADRMLGLRGNDTLDGGRGNDCLDGGVGNDNLSGAVGNDRVYGLRGNDRLNGGPGNDLLVAGPGNDTVNAAFGADRISGGPGRDAINISTAGPPASADCGRGKDKIRINRNERHRNRACETVYQLPDR
jgi:RTX calcium-binding nonapeptide repeat (4 copies)